VIHQQRRLGALDKTLVTRVDDQNQFFELELAPGASPQQLLQRLVTAGAPITRFRAGAAVAASDLPARPSAHKASKRG
jgi:hypothetical protein